MILLTFWATEFFVGGECVHYRMFCSISGLHPLDIVSPLLLSWEPKMSSDVAKKTQDRTILLPVGDHSDKVICPSHASKDVFRPI